MIALHFSASVRAHAAAKSSNSSKNSKSLDVSPLKDGALLEFAPGISLIPLGALDIVVGGWGNARVAVLEAGGMIVCVLVEIGGPEVFVGIGVLGTVGIGGCG